MNSTSNFIEVPPDDEPIRIIEFTEADAPEISDLFTKVWPFAEEYPPTWRQKRCITSSQIIEEMRSGYHYFGARINGNIAGLYKAHMTPKGFLGEHQTVHPDYRHKGLVRAMYRQFITYAREEGAVANLCNILISQVSMCELVEGFGFQPQGPPYEQASGMMVQLYVRPTD